MCQNLGLDTSVTPAVPRQLICDPQGRLYVVEAPLPTAPKTGQLKLLGLSSPQALAAAGAVQVKRAGRLLARKDNAGPVYVAAGLANPNALTAEETGSGAGFPLYPGESLQIGPMGDLNALVVLGNRNDAVSWYVE